MKKITILITFIFSLSIFLTISLKVRADSNANLEDLLPHSNLYNETQEQWASIGRQKQVAILVEKLARYYLWKPTGDIDDDDDDNEDKNDDPAFVENIDRSDVDSWLQIQIATLNAKLTLDEIDLFKKLIDQKLAEQEKLKFSTAESKLKNINTETIDDNKNCIKADVESYWRQVKELFIKNPHVPSGYGKKFGKCFLTIIFDEMVETKSGQNILIWLKFMDNNQQLMIKTIQTDLKLLNDNRHDANHKNLIKENILFPFSFLPASHTEMM